MRPGERTQKILRSAFGIATPAAFSYAARELSGRAPVGENTEAPTRMTNPMHPEQPTPSESRRDFCAKAGSVVLGGLITAVPAAAGVAVVLDPLRRKSNGGAFLRVTTLEALPNDGVPRKFPILASKTDAWTRTALTPVGAVYLRRNGDRPPEALNVVCPHAGCFVDYVPTETATAKVGYYCPCHNSAFGLDGRITDPQSPSPRAMDTLEVQVRNGKEVWVKFQNFQAGHAEKIPAA